MMKNLFSTVLITAAVLTAAVSTASAHVTVWPKETTTGAYEKYTVRVPVEKDVNTTKVRVEFPQGVKVSTVMPTPNWNYEFEKDADGRFTALTWTAANEGLKKHEFAEFTFVGANPKEVGEGKLTWKAFQTYSDGTTVEWAGAPDSKTPASVTTLKAGTSDGHGHAAEPAAPAEHAAETTTTTTGNTLPLVLSGLALLLSVISFFRKKA